METICELCKLLKNPLRLEVLLRTYAAKDGMNVGVLADDMQRSGLGLSGVSQYLKQLERIGVLRRERAGRYVNYLPDARQAGHKVRQAVAAIVAAARQSGVAPFAPAFDALMNPFRARVVAAVARAGAIPALEICEMTRHSAKYLKRDLQAAIDAGILDADDSDTTWAVYRYIAPSDPTARLLVSLVS